MCFNEDRAISTVNSKTPKLQDQFIYIGSNITSNESECSKLIGKAWSDNDRSSTIWKFDLSDKIKHAFYLAIAISVQL